MRWLTPGELAALGFQRSRVVMMNEAHDGLRRSVRTRKVGRSVLPAAHASGVRHLAMEALYPHFAEEGNRTRRLPEAGQGYLSQPEMRAFMQDALDLGWTLVAYEADSRLWLDDHIPAIAPEKAAAALLSMPFTNWREEEQPRNLVAALKRLPPEGRMLVWCGNGHHGKSPVSDWVPMGHHFIGQTGLDPFVIDQNRTVRFEPEDPKTELESRYRGELSARGGTAGFLAAERPEPLAEETADAFILSTDNELE